MTSAEARDEIMGMLWERWQTDAALAANATEPPPLIWEDEDATPPSDGAAFARATLKHSSGRQASLAGSGGVRRWERTGLVVVMCFGPREQGLTVAEAMADVAKNAFEGRSSPSGAWFRNVRVEEVGPDKGWWQINAVAEFLYDEVR